MIKKFKYIAGISMEQFEHIPQISCYNHNYYKGFGTDLLYADSDDDQTTEWYLVNDRGRNDFRFLGVSFVEDETLQI